MDLEKDTSIRSAETRLTSAWQRQAPWLWLLLPISWIYGAIVWLRRLGYRIGWFKQYQAPVPVLVVGNITVGGSGKTPLIIELVDYLQHQGVVVGVISRGYGGDESVMPAFVTADSQPSRVGDEPCLIVSQSQVPMAVCPNRKQAIETLMANAPDVQLIIADDGLQHYALARDIEWIVVDESRGFGNGQLLPTGFLREPVSRLQNSTVIWHQTSKSGDNTTSTNDTTTLQTATSNERAKLTMTLKAEILQPLIDGDVIEFLLEKTKMETGQTKPLANTRRIAKSADFSDIKVGIYSPPQQGDRVHAVSGIGYPQRFFTTLKRLGFEVIEHPFPDHHDFIWEEFAQLKSLAIIMTSKDAVKVRQLVHQQIEWISKRLDCPITINDNHRQQFEHLMALLPRLWVLPVTAELSNSCYQTLRRQLADCGIDY